MTFDNFGSHAPTIKKRVVSLLGKRFGYLEPKKYLGVEGNPKIKRLWECFCHNCKKVVAIRTESLVHEGRTNCGCIPQKLGGNAVPKFPLKESIFRNYISTYKNSCKKRDIEWNLSYEEAYILLTSSCHYCNSKPAKNYSSRRGTIVINGIDRVNSSIGYIKDNCVSCCKYCNFGKNNLSKEDFMNHILSIYDFLFKGKKKSKENYTNLPNERQCITLTKRIKALAISRNISWEIEDLSLVSKMLVKPCNYCGGIFSKYKINRKKDQVIYNGIDRIDSSKGYKEENIVTCCKYCNNMKNNLSLEDFKNKILSIVANNAVPRLL